MSTLLTIKDVAQRLQVSERTIERWMEDGKIAFIKIGKSVRMREEHLENWLDKKTVKAKKIA
jgi:excisionase family DNA binding protein